MKTIVITIASGHPCNVLGGMLHFMYNISFHSFLQYFFHRLPLFSPFLVLLRPEGLFCFMQQKMCRPMTIIFNSTAQVLSLVVSPVNLVINVHIFTEFPQVF